MPKLFITGIVLFLLLGAGYGILQAARSIPWNCADWQAFAHSDRNTAILESLAENRGKTLYCGIDQSDTFAKAETWQAGKDRNERDDTVYFGERGHFRGFIAAQEGWLTEVESGITGQSEAVIFEFPRKEKKRRRYKTVVTEEMAVPAAADRLADSPAGPTVAVTTITQSIAQARARTAFLNNPPPFDWNGRALAAARTHCRALGYNRAVNAATIIPDPLVWAYTPDRDPLVAEWLFEAYQTRQWTATCQKTKRRRR